MHTSLAAILLLSTAATIPDGSILVLHNSNKPVALATNSDITHVAVVFQHGDTDWVYEATPAQVRRLTLGAYKREMAEINVEKRTPSSLSVLEPRNPYDELQVKRMKSYAAAQIGRRYSIKGYVRGNEFDGIHCAQLAAATLDAGGRFQFDETYALTPDELVNKIRDQYEAARPMSMPAAKVNETWCEGTWRTWFNYGAWCRWACYETWSFCW